MAFLRIERDGAIVVLTMDDQPTRNALTGNSAVAEFVAAAEMIARDRSIRVGILTGAGPIFSSGGNLRDMQRQIEPDVTPEALRHEYRNGIQRLAVAVYNIEIPMIAAVNGAAVGAGCDLTCMCDIRIASENATFAESFIKVGLIPGDGGAFLLPRAVGMSKAAEMTFTGDALSASEALACGLVSRVVAPDDLLPTAKTLAAKIAANPGEALRMSKRLLREGQLSRLETVLEMAAGFQAMAHKTEHHREAVTAFLEKRKPDFSKG